jgi:hypothetical protein
MASIPLGTVERHFRELRLRPPRFELGTYGLEVRCSVQLSYGRGNGPVFRGNWSRGAEVRQDSWALSVEGLNFVSHGFVRHGSELVVKLLVAMDLVTGACPGIS